MQVHAADALAVEDVGVAECLSEVVHHHERFAARQLTPRFRFLLFLFQLFFFFLLLRFRLARLILVLVPGHANQPLLLRLAVGVLYERGEQLQRVALRAGRTARGRFHLVELGPCPTFDLTRLDIGPRHLPLDRRDIFIPKNGRRAPLAGDVNRIHVFGAETERPEQAGGRDLRVHLAV